MSVRTARRRAGAGVLASLLALGLMVPATGDELSDLYDQEAQVKAEQDAIADALAQISADLEHTDQALVDAYTALRGIEARIAVAEVELTAAEDRHADLARQAAIVADRLAVAEEEAASISERLAEDTEVAEGLRSAIGRLARDAYKGDLATSALSAVLDATSTEDFVAQTALMDTALRTQTQSLRDLEELAGVNRNREARLEAVRGEIVVLKAEADAKVAEADVARREAEARRADLDVLHEDQRVTTQLLEVERDRQIRLQQEFETQQAQLAADLADIVRAQDEEIERRRQAGEDPPPPGGTGVLGNPTRLNPYYITSHYGMRLHPVLGITRLHAGTDFRAYCGDPIIASDSGTVQWSMMRAGYGNQVMIDHGWHNGASLMTSYSHLQGFTVSRGDVVRKGDLIGYSGNTGTSTACHLHFEVYIDGKTIDPMTMM